MNHRAKYLGQRSSGSKIVVYVHKHRHTYIRTIALSG